MSAPYTAWLPDSPGSHRYGYRDFDSRVALAAHIAAAWPDAVLRPAHPIAYPPDGDDLDLRGSLLLDVYPASDRPYDHAPIGRVYWWPDRLTSVTATTPESLLDMGLIPSTLLYRTSDDGGPSWSAWLDCRHVISVSHSGDAPSLHDSLDEAIAFRGCGSRQWMHDALERVPRLWGAWRAREAA